MKAIARTVRFTDGEVREIREYAELTGEQEAVVLARASLRGLREERFERGLLAYLGGLSSSEAAGMAGVGVVILSPSLPIELVVLAWGAGGLGMGVSYPASTLTALGSASNGLTPYRGQTLRMARP